MTKTTKRWYACVGTTTSDPADAFGEIVQATTPEAAERAFIKAAWDAQGFRTPAELRAAKREAKEFGDEPTLTYLFVSDTEIRVA